MTTENVVPTKDEEAKELAEWHYRIEDGLTHVFRLTSTSEREVSPSEPIKLLEVNENTVASGIMPIQFGPSPASGLHYPSVILEVTPDEYEKIRREEWTLPHGWRIGGLIPKPDTEPGR